MGTRARSASRAGLQNSLFYKNYLIPHTPCSLVFRGGISTMSWVAKRQNAVALFAGALLLSGCTNLLGTAARSTGASPVNYVQPTSGSGLNAITITNVLRDNNRVTEFALVGDGTGQMGNLCMAAASGTGSSGSGDGTSGDGGSSGSSGQNTGSTCSCNYSYIKPDGSTETFDVPTTWVEPNLLRCSFSNISRAAAYVNVRVHLTNSDAYSNTIKYRFAGTGQFLDLTDPRSFVNPFRYQCRDSISIPMAFPTPQGAGAVYDPLLSEDPSISFAWNFYASNMYAATAAFLAKASKDAKDSGGNGSICPATPNDPFFGADLSMYSLGPDSSGSARIFPPTGSAFDRSTFYLAKQPSGVFNVPVNAYIAPGVITSVPADNSTTTTDASKPVPIGYGVAPTPLDNGNESCPDTGVQIPPGFKWVKVFQFRASLNPRMAPRSDRMGRTAVTCNPGNYISATPSVSSTPLPVIDACKNGGLVAGTNDQYLADRAIYGAPVSGNSPAATACIMMTHTSFATPCNGSSGPGTGAGCTADGTGAQKNTLGANYTAWPTASDIWVFRNNPAAHCAGGAPTDTMHLCTNAPYSPPYDDDIRLEALEQASRYDFVMVVTPTTVHYRQMNDPSNSSVLPYLPYRFYPGKCVSGNPSAPAFPGDCAVQNRINYAIKAHDVNTNGDAGPNDGSNGRLPVFPVCALQPI